MQNYPAEKISFYNANGIKNGIANEFRIQNIKYDGSNGVMTWTDPTHGNLANNGYSAEIHSYQANFNSYSNLTVKKTLQVGLDLVLAPGGGAGGTPRRKITLPAGQDILGNGEVLFITTRFGDGSPDAIVIIEDIVKGGELWLRITAFLKRVFSIFKTRD